MIGCVLFVCVLKECAILDSFNLMLLLSAEVTCVKRGGEGVFCLCVC